MTEQLSNCLVVHRASSGAFYDFSLSIRIGTTSHFLSEVDLFDHGKDAEKANVAARALAFITQADGYSKEIPMMLYYDHHFIETIEMLSLGDYDAIPVLLAGANVVCLDCGHTFTRRKK